MRKEMKPKHNAEEGMVPFVILWLSQTLSTLGSSMTSFAITIWVFQQTGSALSLSISGLAVLVPKMVGGLLVGPVIDRLNKKVVIIGADIGAGLSTFVLFLLLWQGGLKIWHIYCINFISGFLASFQSPASEVAITLVTPNKHFARASGMQSFSNGAIEILAPVFAAAALGFVGMSGVIIFDFITMTLACIILIFFVKIPNADHHAAEPGFNLRIYLNELKQGIDAIKGSHLLSVLLIFIAFLNFVSGITYYNLLSPLILIRTDNSATALSLVNSAIGLGSVVGGALVMAIPGRGSKIKTIFFCAGLSFVLGDLFLALGKTMPMWVAAGFLSSVFIPAIYANQSFFWRTAIPVHVQGRAFSLRQALGNGMLSIGMLLGGLLADYVFEPFMVGSENLLTYILGNSEGSGIGLMFLFTGMTGAIISICGFSSRAPFPVR